jgi:hypothetical protein
LTATRGAIARGGGAGARGGITSICTICLKLIVSTGGAVEEAVQASAGMASATAT